MLRPVKRIVNVKVTSLGAVYVNDTRVTGRSTKWGVHNIVCEFRCAPKNVHFYLKQHGFHTIRLDPDYCAEFGI